MEPIEINSTELRIQTRRIMEQVKYHNQIFLIRTFGHPTAIILSVQEYERITGKALGQTGANVVPESAHFASTGDASRIAQ